VILAGLMGLVVGLAVKVSGLSCCCLLGTKLSKEIADFHIISNHDWKRGVIGLVVNMNLEYRGKIRVSTSE
jgi:hypothetical protein